MARRDPQVAELLEKFVCVRMVQMNSVDLSVFEYDYRTTWAVMFLNADKTVYGRYGTRRYPGGTFEDISLESFRKALEAALEIHKNYPANKALLAGKKGTGSKYPIPEAYPLLKKFPAVVSTQSAGKAEDSCVHCHQIHKAEYNVYRTLRQPIPDERLWLYPLPDTVGLLLDPKERATVASVTPGSSAEKCGIRAGDEIVTMDGQPIVSTADVQWVLQHAKDAAKIKVELKRGGAPKSATLSTEGGWRRKGAVDGGGPWEFRPVSDAEDATPEERKKLGLSEKAIAIKITWKDFGLEKGDMIVEVDGRKDGMTLAEFLAYCAQKKFPGDPVSVGVLRGGKKISVQLKAR